MLKTLIIAITCFFCAHATANNTTESSDLRTEYDIYTQNMQLFIDACIGEQWSTAAIVDCQYQVLEKYDNELNRVYQILMKRMNEKSKATLRASQRIWLQYRDAEHAFIDELMKTKIGTMYVHTDLGKKTDILEHRVSELHGHLQFITD